MALLENEDGYTIQGLQLQLEKAGIDLPQWGKGAAKTVAHLQQEIKAGETILSADERGKLLRTVTVVGANIFYHSPDGKTFRLREERQVFADGRERRRNLGHSVSEKMKPDENPRDAMLRGIREELGITGEIELTEAGTDEQLLLSPSYPGLQSRYIRHDFDVVLNDEQFRPEGYIEEQLDKRTCFVWEEMI